MHADDGGMEWTAGTDDTHMARGNEGGQGR